MRQRGLNILEVLIAIVIVSLLLLFALPVFHNGGRSMGPTLRCTVNVKQQAAGLVMYAADYHEKLPPPPRWMEAAARHAKQPDAFTCPLLKSRNTSGYGYAFNDALPGNDLTKVNDPATEVMIFESTYLDRNAHDPLLTRPNPGRHNGVNVHGYADTHVKAIRHP